nr:EamA family transporter [Clostridium sp. MD294]
MYCVIAMIGWGSMFIAAKLAFTALSGFMLIFFRYLIASILLTIFYRKIPCPKLTKEDKKNILFIGVLGYFLSNGLQLIGTKFIAASIAAIINAITPVIIILFAVIILKEKSSIQQFIGILITVIGSIVIIGNVEGVSSILGVIISFTGMILWGLSSVMIRKCCTNIEGIWVTIYGMFIAMVADTPFMIYEIIKNGIPQFTPVVLFAVLWLGVVPTAISNLFWSKALENLSAANCSLFYALLPVVTTILGIIILKENITINFIIGGTIIIAGMIVAVLGENKKEV